jgi:hypothetical protein
MSVAEPGKEGQGRRTLKKQAASGSKEARKKLRSSRKSSSELPEISRNFYSLFNGKDNAVFPDAGPTDWH